MALQKTIATDFGVNATYWRLTMFSMDFNSGKAVCVVVGYTDEAARLAGNKPLSNRQITVGGTDFTSIDEDTSQRTQLYNKIKTTPEFLDAVDV